MPQGVGPDCPFCRQIEDLEKLPNDNLVWQFPHSFVLLGPWQYYQGYCLLVCRQHATELSGLIDAVRRGYLDELCLLAKAIENAFGPLKLNYELLGNQVPHLHWHVFPRYPHDPLTLKPVWLALDAAEHSPAERQRLQTGTLPHTEIIALIRQRIQELVTS
jgi:diadenosine tetraphosphate (Ap4A) HIT family hydrolase